MGCHLEVITNGPGRDDAVDLGWIPLEAHELDREDGCVGLQRHDALVDHPGQGRVLDLVAIGAVLRLVRGQDTLDLLLVGALNPLRASADHGLDAVGLQGLALACLDLQGCAQGVADAHLLDEGVYPDPIPSSVCQRGKSEQSASGGDGEANHVDDCGWC
jgi:hypothetical protein